MKKLFFLFLICTINLSAQNIKKYEYAHPIPVVRFKNWDKLYIPVKMVENGSELQADWESGMGCKVISYRLSVFINNNAKVVDVNSNKLEGKALELFKRIPYNSKFRIENIIVQYSDGVKVKIPEVEFVAVHDELHFYIKEFLKFSPFSNDFEISKTNIRLQVKGNVHEDEIKIVQEVINDLNPLLGNISIKMVDHSPNFILDINNYNKISSKTHYGFDYPFFPMLEYTRSSLTYTKNTSYLEKKSIITKVIVQRLAPVYADNKVSFNSIFSFPPFYLNGQLTDFDRSLIQMLYSPIGREELKLTLHIYSGNLTDNTLLILILSLLIVIIFSELNSKYHFLNIFDFLKSRLLKNIVISVLIAQIPLLLIVAFSFFNPYSQKQSYFSYFSHLSLFAGIVSVFLSAIDFINSKIKALEINLIIDLVLTTLSFILSYQLVFLLVSPELLKPGMIELQWLYIPLFVVAYRFFMKFSQQRISGIIKEKELEISKQKEAIVKSELLALQSRINPHFLYNALNSIASLVRINADKTEKMILSLARLFRYNINKGAEVFSTIEQEIENVKIYLEVEMVRFSDRLQYSIDVEEDLLTTKIPVFLLQPLVENAIKHGISKLTENGIIKIKINSENNWIVISIFDNGPYFPENMMFNYGLQSIYDKLSLLYKEDFSVQFINSPEKNIRIKIKIIKSSLKYFNQ